MVNHKPGARRHVGTGGARSSGEWAWRHLPRRVQRKVAGSSDSSKGGRVGVLVPGFAGGHCDKRAHAVLSRIKAKIGVEGIDVLN